MLLSNRVDMVISKEWVARYALQLDFAPDQLARLEYRPENAEAGTYDYLLLSKKAPNAQYYLTAINNGLKKLRASGRYDAILQAFRRGEFMLPRAEK